MPPTPSRATNPNSSSSAILQTLQNVEIGTGNTHVLGLTASDKLRTSEA